MNRNVRKRNFVKEKYRKGDSIHGWRGGGVVRDSLFTPKRIVRHIQSEFEAVFERLRPLLRFDYTVILFVRVLSVFYLHDPIGRQRLFYKEIDRFGETLLFTMKNALC